jgi:hypothetical protein
VVAAKANKRSFARTADLAGLTREQVVRAMSNERRRLKAQGSTAAGPKVITESARYGSLCRIVLIRVVSSLV